MRDTPGPARMRIMSAYWTARVNMLRIKCECTARFDHPADRWKVRCPFGHTANLGPLRDAWREWG